MITHASKVKQIGCPLILLWQFSTNPVLSVASMNRHCGGTLAEHVNQSRSYVGSHHLCSFCTCYRSCTILQLLSFTMLYYVQS